MLGFNVNLDTIRKSALAISLCACVGFGFALPAYGEEASQVSQDTVQTEVVNDDAASSEKSEQVDTVSSEEVTIGISGSNTVKVLSGDEAQLDVPMDVPADAEVKEDGWLTWTLPDGTVVVKEPDKDPVVKCRVPILKKFVYDEETKKWVKTVSGGEGESRKFKLDGTIPEDLKKYSKYYYAFSDTLPAGETLDEKSVKIKVTSGSSSRDITKSFLVTYDEETRTLVAKCDDLIKRLPGLKDSDIITVEYTTMMNKSETMGLSNPNENLAHLDHTYSILEVDKIVSTPEDKAAVIALRLLVNKVDSDGKALSGAKFILRNSEGKYFCEDGTWGTESGAAKLVTDNGGLITIERLGTGNYTLIESEAPSGYKKAGDIRISISLVEKDGKMSVEAKASGAVLTAADGAKGSVEIKVTDEKDTTPGGGTTPSQAVGEALPKSGAEWGRAILLMCAGIALIGFGVRYFKHRDEIDFE